MTPCGGGRRHGPRASGGGKDPHLRVEGLQVGLRLVELGLVPLRWHGMGDTNRWECEEEDGEERENCNFPILLRDASGTRTERIKKKPRRVWG